MPGMHGGRAESLPEQEERSVLPVLFLQAKEIFAWRLKILLQIPLPQVWGQYISFPLEFPLGSTGLAAPASLPRKQVGFKPSEDTKVLLYKVTYKAKI